MQLTTSLRARLCSRIRTKFKIRLLIYPALLVLLIILLFFKVQTNWFRFRSNFGIEIYRTDKFIPRVHVFEVENSTKPLKIAIWISTKTDDYISRTKLVKTVIVNPQNKNACFQQKYKCELTMNRSIQTMKDADAILFFMFNKHYTWETLPPSWPKWRRQDQIWVINVDEAPVNHVTNVDNGPAVFNWSITYRRDSTIWIPYGRAVLLPPLSSSSSNEDNYNKRAKAEIKINNVTLSEWTRQKTRLIVGVISHCDTQSRREILIDQMIKSGNSNPIDIYGYCGKLTIRCSFYIKDGCWSFWSYLAKRYKFYLAFENSICVDYITEKFWRSLELGMVPVVYGGANYTQLAPRNSFIDVHDFKSAEELMKYLEKVGSDATEYAKYFEWRRHFKLVKAGHAYTSGNDQAWCELCEKLRIFKTNTGVGGGGRISQLPGNFWNQIPNNAMEKPCKTYADLKVNLGNLSAIKYLPSLRKVNVINVN